MTIVNPPPPLQLLDVILVLFIQYAYYHIHYYFILIFYSHFICMLLSFLHHTQGWKWRVARGVNLRGDGVSFSIVRFIWKSK